MSCLGVLSVNTRQSLSIGIASLTASNLKPPLLFISIPSVS